MEKLSLLIFDMDGLMFDTERLSFDGMKEAGRRLGYVFSDEFLLFLIGRTYEDVKEIFSEKFGDENLFEEASNIEVQYSENEIKQHGMPVKAGLYELLAALEEMKIPAAVVTSTGRKKAERNLELAGIREKFAFLVCGDEVARGKPAPDIFLAAAKKQGCLPEECIVLEDSENGIRGAHAAGMRPIVIPDLKQPSDEVKGLAAQTLSSLGDVTAYLEKVVQSKPDQQGR